MSIPWSDADLAQAFAVAKREWSDLTISSDEFGECLSLNFATLAEIPETILQDVYLACACARNVPGALRSFRERFLSVVSLAVRHLDGSLNFLEEVYQRLSETLFVGSSTGQPKIMQYSGQGTLAGFVGTSARRIALRMVRISARFQGEAALVDHLAQFQDVETTMLKLKHRETFNCALSIALRQLPRRERLVLRMNLVERVSTTRIAAMYKVSQSTVSRWIQRSARSIFATVKELVCEELDIDTRELESLLLLVRSQIEITISQANGSGFTLRP